MAKKKTGGRRRRQVSQDSTLFAKDRNKGAENSPEVGQLSDSSGDGLATDGPDESTSKCPPHFPAVQSGLTDWEFAEPISGAIIVDPIELEPCAGCRRLEFWWNHLGVRKCLHCDPSPYDRAKLIAQVAILIVGRIAPKKRRD